MPWTPFPILIVVIGMGILAGGIALTYSNRASLSVLHIPAILLLIIGAAAFISLGGMLHDFNKTNYQIEHCGEYSYTTPTDETSIRDYSALSPASQRIFRQALRGGGEYRTVTKPEDLTYLSDLYGPSKVNFVRYEATCYAFVANERSSIGLAFIPLSIIGILSTVVGVDGLRAETPRTPALVLAGLIPILIYIVQTGLDIDRMGTKSAALGWLALSAIAVYVTRIGINRRLS